MVRPSNNARGSVLDQVKANPPGQVFSPRLALRSALATLIGCLMTAAMLLASFTPYDVWPLAYVALVPMLVALAATENGRWALACAAAGGMAFWLVALYWLSWVTPWGVGYGALILVNTGIWVATAAILRAALRRGWPGWITVPVIWVGHEFFRAYFLSGFPWFFLAHSQYALTRLIQISDTFGQYGVSFLVGMFNGAVFDLLNRPLFWPSAKGARLSRTMIAGVAACAITVAAFLGYGQWRLAQYPQVTSPGPVIGLVQEAIPISLNASYATEEQIFDRYLAASEPLVGKGCDLVVWPEAMVPEGMNPDLLALTASTTEPFFEELHRDAGLVADLSRRLDCPLLAGCTTLHFRRQGEDWQRASLNSALLFDRRPNAIASYSKVHLVPFGEYVPFVRAWPWAHQMLRRFVPDVMSQLEPGEEYTRFEITGRDGRDWRFATPICYEGCFDRVCRKLAMDDGVKKVDFLANISNDGWFARKTKRGHTGSAEHRQHLIAYCFRAIEERVPIVRSVNTGISASIDSCGRIVSVLSRDGEATMISGSLLLDGAVEAGGAAMPQHGAQILVDRRRTTYSLVGDVFAIGVSAIAVGMVGWLFLQRRVQLKGKRR